MMQENELCALSSTLCLISLLTTIALEYLQMSELYVKS